VGAVGADRLSAVKVMPDLRDIAIIDSAVWVSTFRSARLARVDSQGNVTLNISSNPLPGESAAVAWRMIPMGPHGVAFSHQTDSNRTIPLEVMRNAYGGGKGGLMGCGPEIVQSALTVADTSAQAPGSVSTTHIMNTILPVDVAFSPARSMFAIATAGNAFSGDLESVVTMPAPSPGANCEDPEPAHMT